MWQSIGYSPTHRTNSTYFWSCVRANDRMPLLQAGNAYNGAKLNVRQTSTIPRSPAVIKYSPSRDNSMHWKRERKKGNEKFFRRKMPNKLNTNLQSIVMRLMSQTFPIDGVCSHISFVVIDNDESLSWHCYYFRWIEISRSIQRSKQIAKCCVNQYGSVYRNNALTIKKFTHRNKHWILLIDPETTNPNSALITTEVTACSCPVSVARGVGTSPSPTILCVRAFQCHSSTVQSDEPEAM